MENTLSARVLYTYSVLQLGPRKYAILRSASMNAGKSVMNAWEVYKTFSGRWAYVDCERSIRSLRLDQLTD